MTSRRILVAVALGLASAQPAVRGAEPVDVFALPLRLQCVAMDTNGARSNAGRVYITIERWTTDEERQKLIDTLVEKGSEHLMDEIDRIRPRVGYIKTSQSLGWDVQFARMSELPDGRRRLVIATDRPMSFFEMREQTRSKDYDFLLAQIQLDAAGKGEGKLAPAAKVSYDREARSVEIENYSIQPVRLTQVVVEKHKQK